MTWLLNLTYLLLLFAASPWLIYKALTTGKYRRGIAEKFTGRVNIRHPNQPRVWFHGVSVGEIHLLVPVIAAFKCRFPTWEIVVSTTTDTGFEEAQKRLADVQVCFWPLDFSWSVHQSLTRIRPNLIVLAEGELWPNFLRAASSRRVPIAVINGRLSPRTLRRYKRLGPITRRLFSHIQVIAAQSEEYACAYRSLGVPADRVVVTGSVKYDGAQSDRNNPKTTALRDLLHIAHDELVWIAGSTQDPEEAICLRVYARIRDFPNLRLMIVPRQRDRFDSVAEMLGNSGLPFQRRSQAPLEPRHDRPVMLVDSIGELGALWGLADIAFVGGSLDGHRGGQNMIEPAAYGAAVLFGPHVWNFRDTAKRMLDAQAAIQVADESALESAIRTLSVNSTERTRLGAAASQLVLAQQGATERTMRVLAILIAKNEPTNRAA